MNIHQVSLCDKQVKVEVVDKEEMFVQSEEGGLKRVKVSEERQKARVLTDEQTTCISEVITELEKKMGKPQDFEWGIEDGMIQREGNDSERYI